ncbi:hypothetical protein D9611_009969 [Ephemerocybe angulata]|uniref:Uncharacterized protein n=1 Tax=Ephemerocybe angulata TaxID=980116 RepID=A0A8H5C4C3_9AGAR|nr:hypothetical protein D9611_009971 [Tulosesus angulatus]KAF5334967.1 hypothetical protein D9611_009969 [Tulosesus angulatus]
MHNTTSSQHPLTQISPEIDLLRRDASPSPETATAPSALARRLLRPPLDDLAAQRKSIRRVFAVQAFKTPRRHPRPPLDNLAAHGKSIRRVIDVQAFKIAEHAHRIATTRTQQPAFHLNLTPDCTSALSDGRHGHHPTSTQFPRPAIRRLAAVRNRPSNQQNT